MSAVLKANIDGDNEYLFISFAKNKYNQNMMLKFISRMFRKYASYPFNVTLSKLKKVLLK